VLKEYETRVVADGRKRNATNVTVVARARAVPIQQAFENSKKFARDDPKATQQLMTKFNYRLSVSAMRGQIIIGYHYR